jgi:hypothetical protein
MNLVSFTPLGFAKTVLAEKAKGANVSDLRRVLLEVIGSE